MDIRYVGVGATQPLLWVFECDGLCVEIIAHDVVMDTLRRGGIMITHCVHAAYCTVIETIIGGGSPIYVTC